MSLPAGKITETVTTDNLMANAANLKALAEAATMASAVATVVAKEVLVEVKQGQVQLHPRRGKVRLSLP